MSSTIDTAVREARQHIGGRGGRFGRGVQLAALGRIYIEAINGPMLFQLKATPAEYKAGLDRAIVNGWLMLHESGTFVKFTDNGAQLFA